jgi:hypothetical protein
MPTILVDSVLSFYVVQLEARMMRMTWTKRSRSGSPGSDTSLQVSDAVSDAEALLSLLAGEASVIASTVLGCGLTYTRA